MEILGFLDNMRFKPVIKSKHRMSHESRQALRTVKKDQKIIGSMWIAIF